MTLPSFLTVHRDGTLLAVKLQPRASANGIGEPLGDALRIRVTAPPVESAANEALVQLLAEALGCSRRQVELIRGHASRRKVIKLHGLAAEAVLRKLVHHPLR
jgi:uncharacterized protein